MLRGKGGSTHGGKGSGRRGELIKGSYGDNHETIWPERKKPRPVFDLSHKQPAGSNHANVTETS